MNESIKFNADSFAAVTSIRFLKIKKNKALNGIYLLHSQIKERSKIKYYSWPNNAFFVPKGNSFIMRNNYIQLLISVILMNIK